MATVNELVTALGFELKPDALKNINNFEVGISHLQDAVGKLGRMLTGGLSIKDYFSNALGRSQDIMNSAKAIGMSTDALQEWQYAAKASGVSAESVISDIENLRANFFMTEKGMLRLADSFKRMSAGGAYWYGNMYGLSKDTVLMLRQGSAALKQMQDEAHKMGAITPQEELEKAAKLNAELEKRKVALQKIVDTIILKVAPVVEKMLKKFDEWMAEDPGRAQLVIEGITAALMGLASSEILSGIGSVVNLIKSLMVGIAGMGPYGLVLAGVGAAVYGLYEDFKKFQNDGESLIPWDKVMAGAESAKELFRDLKKIATDLYDAIKKLGNEFPSLGAAFDGIGEMISGSLDAAWRIIQSITGSIGVLIDWAANDRTWKGMKERFAALGDSVWKGFGQEKEKPTSQTNVHPLSILEPNLKSSFDMQSVMDITPGKSLVNEVGLKSTSIRSLAETLAEVNTSPAVASTSTVTKNADFNGANINIITGATSEDIIDALTAMGGDVNNSFNGTGFIY